MSDIKALCGRVVTPEHVIEDGAVVYKGDTIMWVGEVKTARYSGFAQAVEEAERIEGGYILPGLVDVHCHGGGGESFPDAETPEQALTAVLEHRRHGTTTLVASLVTASSGTLKTRAEMLRGLCDAGELAGIHFEGPFVGPKHCGAQNPAHIVDADADLVRELATISGGWAVSMTIAPEKKGALGPNGAIAALVECGMIPSLGHTDGDVYDWRVGINEAYTLMQQNPGARCPVPTVTHLFNGMQPMHHRDPGPIPEILAASEEDKLIVEMIGDGVHLYPGLVYDVYRTIGREHIVLVTDAMAAAGMPDGDYVLGDQAVCVTGGQARLFNATGPLAGGTTHLIDQLPIMVKAGWPVVDAVYCMSAQGSIILGDERIGSLEAGCFADIVLVDDDLKPYKVFRRGEEIR